MRADQMDVDKVSLLVGPGFHGSCQPLRHLLIRGAHPGVEASGKPEFSREKVVGVVARGSKTLFLENFSEGWGWGEFGEAGDVARGVIPAVLTDRHASEQ